MARRRPEASRAAGHKGLREACPTTPHRPLMILQAICTLGLMGDSINFRRAVRAAAADRFNRRAELWREAIAERDRWRREMVPPAIAAVLLGIHRNTLLRWVAAGRITAHKLGPERQSPTRFRRSDIARLKAEMSGEPVPHDDTPMPNPPA